MGGQEPEPAAAAISDVDLHVETNVLRYLQRALRDPAPPAERAPDAAAAADWVAATRLFLYAPLRGWRLWVSDTVHQELDLRDLKFGEPGWAEPLFDNLDGPHGAPPPAMVDTLASSYLHRFGRQDTPNDRNDMRHLARVVLVDWLGGLITNDRRLLREAQQALAADIPERRTVVLTPVSAVAALALTPGSQPPRRPAPSNPQEAATAWWIP